MTLSKKTRLITVSDLGVVIPSTQPPSDAPTSALPPATKSLPTLDASDHILEQTRKLREDGFAGVILSGPPGTSKSYYARRLAACLADADESRVRFVQFHPSYQYEDFIESYEPTDTGGFRPKPRTFLLICELAIQSPDKLFVLVIDELSRCDAVRVFGEALTYLEASQRDVEFELASGRRMIIPRNLFVIATMNPWDRGVDELDMAFERRFAKIAMEPNAQFLAEMLRANNLPEVTRNRLVGFFKGLQTNSNQFARIGHAYFSRVNTVEELNRLWKHQLKFHFEKAFRQDSIEFERIEQSWERIFRGDQAAAPAQDVQPPFEEGVEIGTPASGDTNSN